VTSIDLDEGESWIRTLGMRYANTRGLSELLANACTGHERYREIVRESLVHINKAAELAMAKTLAGDPTSAVEALLKEADQTLNAKLVDMSQQVLLRQRDRMPTADALQESINRLRKRMGSTPIRAILGQDSERTPGGMALRVRTPGEDALPSATSPADLPPLDDDEARDAPPEADSAPLLRVAPPA
jgi:hypothetical protein